MGGPVSGAGRFLDLSENLSAYPESRIAIWPVPYERTTSWKQGTRRGPGAILDASAQVETYDDELGWEPATLGIHTLKETDPSSLDELDAIEQLYEAARGYVGDDKFLFTLGGEHTVSVPIVRALSERYQDLSVLQIDAHADLRESYDGSAYSHACVMRRIVEICPAVQVGIRSLSRGESEAIERLPTRVFFARDISQRANWIEEAAEALTGYVYVTVDVDGLDPSIIPATGTPEPGGLDWFTVLALLRHIGRKREVVGADIVELLPMEGFHAADFACAKLAYKIVGYAFDQRRGNAG